MPAMLEPRNWNNRLADKRKKARYDARRGVAAFERGPSVGRPAWGNFLAFLIGMAALIALALVTRELFYGNAKTVRP
jgi:hypothetical protein